MDLYRKEVFRQYNRAKCSAMKGNLDPKRLNRALGLLMSKRFYSKIAEYGTTYNSCGCPDSTNRTTFCKHRLAIIIAQRATQVAQGTVNV
jgi:hypothetical protein